MPHSKFQIFQTDIYNTMMLRFFSTNNHKYYVRQVKMFIFTAGGIKTVEKKAIGHLNVIIFNSIFIRGQQRLPVTSLFPPQF